MSRLDPTAARPREKVLGAIIALVGVGVLVLSIVALAAAGDNAASDVSGPTVTLPGGSSSSAGSAGSSAAPSTDSGSGGTPTDTGSTGGSGSPTGSASGTAGSQPLVVLNNTREVGLAAQVAATFTQGGWTVSSTGNIDEDILSTCAYYDPSTPGAQQAAEALMAQFPAIKRTKEKFGALPDGPVVVVLTDDYTAQ